jgi:hypothetical protein
LHDQVFAVVLDTLFSSARRDLDACWEKIMSKLQHRKSKIRVQNDGAPNSSQTSAARAALILARSSCAASFMSYAFCDAIVDFTFPLVESYAAKLELIEKDMVGLSLFAAIRTSRFGAIRFNWSRCAST